MRIEVADNEEQLAHDCGDRLASMLATTPATLGLAGGSTPIAAYGKLAEHDLDWAHIVCWLPDERWVPPEDEASNARMARTELIDRTAASLLAPDTTVESPAEAAAAYQTALQSALAVGPSVVLLGIGADGHTASLFAGTAALDIAEPAYVPNWVDALGAWRLTATASLLRGVDHIVFLASGSGKAAVLREILVEEVPHPARLVAEGARDVTWLLDTEAAALL
jgi:6-phosphogluconolactonase